MKGILVFGASTTWGRGDNEYGGWVGHLKKEFESLDYYNAIYNLAISGETSQELLARMEGETKARVRRKREGDRYHIIIGIGTNDARMDNQEKIPKTEEKEFRKNIRELVKIAKRYADTVLVLGLTRVDETRTQPYQETWFSNELLSQYNDTLSEIATEEGIGFLSLFTLWTGDENPTFLGDGLHPNSKGYEKMYAVIREKLIQLKLLKSKI